jgi:sugar phosphate isomerase/epimerase
MDMSRVSVWSGALTDRSPEKAMEIIAAIGYKKIDLLERLPHLSLFPDECNPVALKAAAKAHGLQIDSPSAAFLAMILLNWKGN